MTAQQNEDENMTQDGEEGLSEQPLAGADEAETETDSMDPVEKLESELQAARLEAVEAKEDMLRMQADMVNLRKRLVREHEKTRLRTA